MKQQTRQAPGSHVERVMVRRRVAAATGKRDTSVKNTARAHIVEIGAPVDLGITMSVCRPETLETRSRLNDAASRQEINSRVPISDVFLTEH